jgi:hypothetical protein
MNYTQPYPHLLIIRFSSVARHRSVAGAMAYQLPRSVSWTRDSKKSSEQTERLAATLILTPFATAACALQARSCREVCWRRQRDRPFAEMAQAKAIASSQARDFFHES